MYCNWWQRGWVVPRILSILVFGAMLTCAGCQLAGVAAAKLQGEEDISPAYSGLKGQRVAIMVWADEGVAMDHPNIRADVADGLRGKLQQCIDAELDDLKNTTFLSTAQVLRFQDAHPEAQADSAEQIALRFPATRLIYVEVESLSLHPSDSLDLSRGQVMADVKAVEVANGRAKLAYQIDSVGGVYPKQAPPEGMPGLSDELVYHKTIDLLTSELAKLFITHEADVQ
ncbi:MAG: hypothetical protein ABSB42_00315 [Tepidisphaeraceae bacterium]|jgi:hypothetical protein